jgi:type IV pilus assembly protein PilC
MSSLTSLAGYIPYAKCPYRITCEDATGLVFTTYINAFSEHEIRAYVTHKEWKVKDVQKMGRFYHIQKVIKGDFSGFRTVNSRALVSFYKQLAAMYKNNVPMTEALAICAESTESKAFRKMLMEVKEDLERGNDFASCLAKHSKAFDRTACTAIKAADTGGYLDKALYSQAESAAMSDEMNRKINGAMIYPTMVGMLGMVAIFFFSYKILPNFQPLFASSGVALPAPTLIMLEISEILKKAPWLMPIGLAMPIYIFFKKKQIFSTPFMQSLMVRTPIIKKLIIAIYMARFMRMIAQLTEASIPYNIQALMLREASNVDVYQGLWGKVKRLLDRGVAFNDALQSCGNVLPPMVFGNLKAGEKAGQVEEIANFVADYYEADVKERLKNINTIIEPVLIIMLGFVVCFILLAMFLPLFDLTKAIG